MLLINVSTDAPVPENQTYQYAFPRHLVRVSLCAHEFLLQASQVRRRQLCDSEIRQITFLKFHIVALAGVAQCTERRFDSPSRAHV